MPTICHFEIPADDQPRAKAFYEKLFNWKFEHMPEMDYYGISTGPDKSLGGGMMKRQKPDQPIMVYIDVDCVDTYSERVQKLGGRVVMGKTAVVGMGWFAICLDSENNPFGLWEQDKEAK
ncbi:MAG: VOC family protein [bacterium]|nr:VOC family protein [bacterium]